MRTGKLLLLSPLVLAFSAPRTGLAAQPVEPLKVILDTDLGFAADDAMALLVLLQSPRVELLGITVVTGNDWLQQEVVNALRLLEIAGRPGIGVYPGAELPLINRREEMLLRERIYGETSEGGYKGAWRPGGPGPRDVTPPDGRLAKQRPESLHAAQFIIRTVRAHPHEVVLVAIGPLTNVALAVAEDPGIAPLTKRLVIMGGGIRTLAEFNFWMDPEAARIVLRAEWPKLTLTPLNICWQAPFTKEVAQKAASGASPIAEYFRKVHVERPERPVASFMYDQIAAVSLIDPQVVRRSRDLWVDVEIDHGASYGATLFWDEDRRPPSGIRRVEVQLELNYDRFMARFLKLMTAPVPSTPKS